MRLTARLLILCLSLFSLRTTDHAQAAALSGMAQTVGYTVAAAGPVLFGALRPVAFGITAAALIVTATIWTLLRAKGLGTRSATT